MKMLITGGAGFIGFAVIRDIITHINDEVVNLDVLTYARNLEILTEVTDNDRYAFERVDICNSAELDRVGHPRTPRKVYPSLHCRLYAAQKRGSRCRTEG